MKLVDILLLSLAVVCVIIGIHQIMLNGFMRSYWIVMLAFLFFFLYNYRKKR